MTPNDLFWARFMCTNKLIQILLLIYCQMQHLLTFFIIYYYINPFQPSVAFPIETSQLFCSAKQMTGFYMKRNTRTIETG